MDPFWWLHVFDLDESTLAFVREHKWLSIVIVLTVLVATTIYATTFVGKAARQVRRLWPHLATWYGIVVGVLAVSGMLIISVYVVYLIRVEDLPVPSMSRVEPVYGEDQMLHWAVPVQGLRGGLVFEVQSSEDATFPLGQRTTVKLVRDTFHPLSSLRNKTLYWRVRAVEVNPITSQPVRHGAWSLPVRIPQYTTVLEKIVRTRQLNVAMENQFGRSKFRWFETPEPATPGETQSQTRNYRGVEIDIAYAIADEICRRSLDRVQQKKKAICVPSKVGDEQDAAFERCAQQTDTHCIKIDVHFAPVPWSEVMTSVGQGRYDMAMSNITYKPEREDEFGILFGTESYESTGHTFVSRSTKSGTSEIGPVADDPEALLRGNAVAVQYSTTSANCLQALQETLAAAAGDGKSWSFKVVKRTRNVLAVTTLLRNRANYDYVLTDGTYAEAWKDLRGSKLTLIHAAPDFFGKDAPDTAAIKSTASP